jgi:hypothetical protein
MDIYAKEGQEIAGRKQQAAQQRDKEKLVSLPRAHGGGGGPGDKPSVKEPANVNEGVKNALAAWRDRGR